MSSRFPEVLSKSWIRALLTPFRAHAGIALALGVATAGFAALLMFVSGYLVSRTAQPGTTLFMVMVPVALVQLFGIGRPLARYLERLVSHDWVFRVTAQLRTVLFEAIEASAGNPSATRETGAYLELVTEDIGHVQNLYLRVAFPSVIALLLLVITSVFCGAFSPALGLAFFLFSAVSALLVPLAAHFLARPLQARFKKLMSDEYARLADDVIGATDWALSGRSRDVLRSHALAGEAVLEGADAVRRLVRLAQLVSAIALAACACAVACIAGWSFQAGGDGANLIAAFALGLFPVAEAFALLPTALVDVHRHADSLQRLDGIIDDADGKPQPARRPPAGHAGCAIVLDGVTFQYPQAVQPALADMSLSVPFGQKVAVIGRSGSGKTTLACLMRGAMEPTRGSVSFGAADSKACDDAPLVGYLPQSPHVFDRTLRENLVIAKPQAGDDELGDALERVGLAPKLESLEHGLDTPVGETGVGFSGGEAHRLALARALLAGSPIMLLDEPFTSLDPATEEALLETLLEAFAGKTLIVITHHLASIERFDRVVFLDDGRLLLDDSPQNLMRENARFRQLVSFDRFCL